jgi:hypothetical protein
MSLSVHEQVALNSIEGELARSDPGLASRLATFARLAKDAKLPEREQIRAGRRPDRPALTWRRHRWPEASRSVLRPSGWAFVLVWLAVSAGLVVSALVLTRGDGRGGCGIGGTACTGASASAYGHAAPAAPPALPPGRTRQSAGHGK